MAMIIFMSVFSKISIIVSILCLVWLVVLFFIWLINFIKLKVKAKKEIEKYGEKGKNKSK